MVGGSEGFQEVAQNRSLADNLGVKMSDDGDNSTQDRAGGFHVEGRHSVVIRSQTLKPASLGLNM